MRITGHKLIELGFKPSKWFKEALEHFNSLDELTDDIITSHCIFLDEENRIETVSILETPLPYKIYLEKSTKEEVENFDAVVKVMGSIMKTPTIVDGAIMPDACPVGGNNIPVGSVAVTHNTIHPMMHSSDLCCSVAASEINDNGYCLSLLLNKAMQITQFGPGGKRGFNQYGLEDDPLYQRILDNYFTKDYIEKACSHLGTQGDGNHFFYVGKSDLTGKAHIVTHHGSRGFGASVYKKAMHEAQKHCSKICPETSNPWLDYTTDLGKEYWEALQIVKQWTYLNHQIIHNKVLNAAGLGRSDFYWNEHNFVFKDDDRFYHAKGSTPMSSKFSVGNGYSEKRIIPLNMAQPILIVEEHEDNTFGFAPHGAGRNLSRTAFEKKFKNMDLGEAIRDLDIRFYSGIPDYSEYPDAYKNADEVVRQIELFNLARIVDKIQPFGCIMAGKQVFQRK